MDAPSGSSESNAVRKASVALFSLPDVLTDVGITNEGPIPSDAHPSSTTDENSGGNNTQSAEPSDEGNGLPKDMPFVNVYLDDLPPEFVDCYRFRGDKRDHNGSVCVKCVQSHVFIIPGLRFPTTSRHNDTNVNFDNDTELLHTLIQNETTTAPQETQEYPMAQYTFASEPQLITGVWEEFKKIPEECFTKGCKWSPDGTCILTNSEDNVLRIFDLPRELHCQEFWPEGRTLPELKSTLLIKEGGRVYDYCWYPFMSSWNPLSCCLVSTSQFSPVHLWDAYTGQLRASYRSYNSVDEIEHAYSLAFNLTGEKLYCGFKKRLSVFDTASPGSSCENRNLRGLGRPVGIVSCICVNPANESIYAFSSYSRTIGICTEPDGQVICLLCNEGGGLTHIMFSPDGTKLYAGSRNDSQLFCWDMRNLGSVLFTAERTNNTNQRIYFDITPDGRYLVSGSTDGLVHVWDTQDSLEQVSEVPFLPVKTMFRAHNDCVNGLSLHKQYPIMATSSGQRHPYCPDCESDDEAPPQTKKRHVRREDTLKLWWVGRNASPSNQQQTGD